jgi:uncharacterized membrane protein
MWTRIALYAVLGLVLDAIGVTLDTVGFWCILALFWAVERNAVEDIFTSINKELERLKREQHD